MKENSDKSAEARHAQQLAANALRMVAMNMPWLSPLVYAVQVSVDSRFSVAAVTRSGHVMVNPTVFANISLREATYVMAHELLHLALDTFSRETEFDDPETINIAHDYVINDLLRTELSMSPPLCGLDLYGASEWSMEKIVAWMEDEKKHGWLPDRCWHWSPDGTGGGSNARNSGDGGSIMSRALLDAGLLPDPDSAVDESTDATNSGGTDHVPTRGMDVIFPTLEHELFPDQAAKTNANVGNVEAAVRQVTALKSAQEISVQPIGDTPGNQSAFLEAVRNYHQPPWQLALQRWVEAVAPGDRTYARPSRRGADRRDVVLPGRSRVGWTLHIVLDTSGSMTQELAACLGAISDFCESVGIFDVHILQCDTEVTVDEWIAVEQLENYRIAGFGGSNMSPAMNRLKLDPEVTAVVVITDGWIGYPEDMDGCEVLWAVTGMINFEPPYGTVLHLK